LIGEAKTMEAKNDTTSKLRSEDMTGRLSVDKD
jgi:hypothetical protein